MSVSEHAYVALAKGGVVEEHLLVVPIQCLARREDMDAGADTLLWHLDWVLGIDTNTQPLPYRTRS